ncbi:Phenylcoumaran benzylic ether reductase TP7 [Pseudocercospora fuligena]|uniref:Phenylcoumaran benzylic ether reductase TP7 n=1 Tax=Pseudocercospora fuligena TaxID=685502 RepID=A0A8H6RDI7_9PEZI|nr:Phenylcoumaran benzylic ether reductase TP7 [Pseudocercospora fuligena]
MKTTVGILGASGETGQSIVNGLFEAGNFKIIALTRPSSISKPANQALAARGIELRPCDLSSTQEHLVNALQGVEILISAIVATEQLAQIPLASAAKAAGVKRFLPCAFVPVIPAGGISLLRDHKEIVYNHVKQLGLPYTILDVGWWYQLCVRKLPSGRTDYAVLNPDERIPGDGNVPSALTDLRDIGRYAAKVIADDRTLNKNVLVYNEMWSPLQIVEHWEKISGEKLERTFVSETELKKTIESCGDDMDMQTLMVKIPAQYLISWGIRGDNQPEYAKYLGYVTSKELYPQFEPRKFEDYTQEVLDGKAPQVYEELKAKFAEMMKK